MNIMFLSLSFFLTYNNDCSQILAPHSDNLSQIFVLIPSSKFLESCYST